MGIYCMRLRRIFDFCNDCRTELPCMLCFSSFYCSFSTIECRCLLYDCWFDYLLSNLFSLFSRPRTHHCNPLAESSTLTKVCWFLGNQLLTWRRLLKLPPNILLAKEKHNYIIWYLEYEMSYQYCSVNWRYLQCFSPPRYSWHPSTIMSSKVTVDIMFSFRLVLFRLCHVLHLSYHLRFPSSQNSLRRIQGREKDYPRLQSSPLPWKYSFQGVWEVRQYAQLLSCYLAWFIFSRSGAWNVTFVVGISLWLDTWLRMLLIISHWC